MCVYEGDYPVYKDTYRLYFQTSQIQEQETIE